MDARPDSPKYGPRHASNGLRYPPASEGWLMKNDARIKLKLRHSGQFDRLWREITQSAINQSRGDASEQLIITIDGEKIRMGHFANGSANGIWLMHPESLGTLNRLASQRSAPYHTTNPTEALSTSHASAVENRELAFATTQFQRAWDNMQDWFGKRGFTNGMETACGIPSARAAMELDTETFTQKLAEISFTTGKLDLNGAQRTQLGSLRAVLKDFHKEYKTALAQSQEHCP